jgi:hypothetical protein
MQSYVGISNTGRIVGPFIADASGFEDFEKHNLAVAICFNPGPGDQDWSIGHFRPTGHSSEPEGLRSEYICERDNNCSGNRFRTDADCAIFLLLRNLTNA